MIKLYFLHIFNHFLHMKPYFIKKITNYRIILIFIYIILNSVYKNLLEFVTIQIDSQTCTQN